MWSMLVLFVHLQVAVQLLVAHPGAFGCIQMFVTGRVARLAVCTQLCLTLLDCSPLGSSVHGILQARILEWAAISFFRANQIRSDQLLSRVQLFSTA